MKPLKALNKKDRKFINYRASYCNPRPRETEQEIKKLQKKNEEKDNKTKNK